MATVSRTDLMLLGLLISAPMHGYEIAETISGSRLSSWVKLGRTSVYYALGRLEREGLVTRHAERHGGKPERSVYSITDAGRETFQETLQQALAKPVEPMDDFDVALFYSEHLQGPLVAERVGERVGALERNAVHLTEAAHAAAMGRDHGLALVLEHRLAILKADLDYLSKLLAMLREGRGGSQGMSGSLAEIRLHQLVRNLSSLDRTGTLTVHLRGETVAFEFADGHLYGAHPERDRGLEESLRRAFSAREGMYEFVPSVGLSADALPLEGARQAILIGCRGVTEAGLLSEMLPKPDTVLDVRDGYEIETIGLDLTEDERKALGEVDGVRYTLDLARVLGWERTRIASTLYPLWAVGWVVRGPEDKRELVHVMSEYLGGWSEAISLLATEALADRVFEEIGFAARGAGLPDFWAARRSPESVSFKGSFDTMVDAARSYLGLVFRAVSARFGESLAQEVASGISARLPSPYRAVLARYRLASESEGGRA